MMMFQKRSDRWVSVVMLLIVLASVPAFAEKEHRSVVCAKFSCCAGLIIDSRGCLYSANPQTGNIYCIPPGIEPVLLGRVEGKPTVLAVDRLRILFVATESGVVYQVERTGEIKKAFHVHGTPVGLAVDRDGGLIIAIQNGTILRVRRSGLLSMQ
ncbi:NHL repeat-containing protein [Pseudodesulfovibrio piezophilus]|uniref:NHL repeat containing protein n=1 Tax=Pseudodesulfovibrio piezophilus (strain DSM 21447 / JCM 15486 / C1TLV30) TaxID=1322246 RepID=M1WJP5_PSEP2|nr:hypothetical protein [Pseudodesulfovibrio piezophilus]CCH48256.1 exported protein of unknown function [Pseudodesulfovibrio piezophilus C1TLV30]